MYSFSNENDKYYIHLICECGRKHRADEMYICFSCNKVLCGRCLNEEIEYCYCKSNCRKNQNVHVNQAKSIKNSCDQCLECPSCKVVLNKKLIDGKFVYACSYCFWDSSNIKFVSKEEVEIEGLIYQLKDSNIKGYLRKYYDNVLNKLKSNDEATRKTTLKRSQSISRYNDDNEEDNFSKALNCKTWEVPDLEQSLEDTANSYMKCYNIQYNDNYILDKNNFAFQAVNYLEKGLNKIDSLDSLKDKLKNEYDISVVTGINQRLNNLISQHISNHVYFPQFVKFATKKSKRCKACKKVIVQFQSEDITKRGLSSQKFEMCHLFINQLPFCYINKINPSENNCYLKFIMFDFKEAKICFKQKDPNVLLPKGVYDLSDKDIAKDESDNDLISITERCVVLKFGWTDKHKLTLDKLEKNLILTFIVSAEYTRLETKTIDYPVEIKLSYQ